MADTEGGRQGASIWGGVAFWVAVIFAPLVYGYFSGEAAEVFIDASINRSAQQQTVAIQGRVTFGGLPVQNGIVHVILVEAKKKRYLASTVLNVGANGSFGPAELSFPREQDLKAFKITANFRGQSADKDKKSLAAETTIYLNYPPPLAPHTVWGLLATLLLIGLALIYLFTTEMTKFKLKIFYGAMYFITFMSLAVPIAVTVLVSQNTYLVELMADAPIGLVKGKPPGVDAPQWFINIGGIVHEGPTAAPAPADMARTAAVADAAKSATGSAPNDQVADVAAKAPPVRPAVEQPVVTGSDVTRPLSVEGGLAIPFYMILLAIFGAAINMTLKVPQIQGAFQDVYEKLPGEDSWLISVFSLFSRRQAAQDADLKIAISQIRMKLIQNYMYLLSAPFLAIAVYYLLQVIASQVAQPVLVLMGFATGLTSDTMVRAIIEFARKNMGGTSKAEAEKEAEEIRIKADAEVEAAKYKAQAKIAAAKAEQAEAETEQIRAENAKKNAQAQAQSREDDQSKAVAGAGGSQGGEDRSTDRKAPDNKDPVT